MAAPVPEAPELRIMKSPRVPGRTQAPEQASTGARTYLQKEDLERLEVEILVRLCIQLGLWHGLKHNFHLK